MSQDIKSLLANASALKAQGRLKDALDLSRQAVATFPNHAIARHNLAGILGDLGQWDEAETQIRHAMKLGLDAPETWLVLARALVMLGRGDEALEAFKTTLERRPNFFPAHREAAQLIWMQTGDGEAATQLIDAYLAKPGADQSVLFVKAKVLEHAQHPERAFETIQSLLAFEKRSSDVFATAVHMALACNAFDEARRLADQALALAPTHPVALTASIYADLALGRAEQALVHIEQFRTLLPDNQTAIALQSTAWRLLGDPRADGLLDYDDFVGGDFITVPQGWSDLESYLKDLAQEIEAHNNYESHPFGHSVRFGGQTPDILNYDTPAISNFLGAITPVIDGFIAELGQGDDPIRRRNTGRWAIHGIWAVWLPPGGFNENHVHPDGWISSACHIQIPPSVNAGGHEGWLGFGEPGLITQPKLPVEHFVKPRPGRLNLFPSYMWHGTQTFKDDTPRMTIALDIIPA